MTRRTSSVIIGLLLLLILLRLPGLHLPYHQDEWKNVSAASSIESAGKFFAHPPLQQIMFTASYAIFGENNMRLMPLVFGIAAAAMLYIVVARRGGKSAALWALGLFVICFYAVLGSLMTDVDGTVLPFFFLVAVYAYDRFTEVSPGTNANKWRWFTLMTLALLLGFLVKLNFVLAVGALAIDYLWHQRTHLGIWKESEGGRKAGLKKLSLLISSIIGFGVLYVLFLYLTEKIYPAFSISLMRSHAGQFSDSTGRNFIQIIVQATKAIYYVSPLVLLLPLWMNREIFKKTLTFWIYLVAGLLFYLIVFDFSAGALDKYLMFIIVPLCAIGGMVLAKVFERTDDQRIEAPEQNEERRREKGGGTTMVEFLREYWLTVSAGLIISIGLILLNFLPQTVVPLYPKTEWFSRVLHGEWNVLSPFNGGSGPMGFYISFLFIAVSYVLSLACIIIGRAKNKWRTSACAVLILIGLVYNAVFIREYIAGSINGSAPKVLEDSLVYIRSNQEIRRVLTYNDIGAHKLVSAGVYAGRFYAAPQFEEGHRERFAENMSLGGYFLVVGIPPLYDGFYSDFFSKCDTLFTTRSGKIEGRVYSCKPQNP